MNIGILTFSAVPNFGANLQALSTYYYFINAGYNPILINWTPLDFQQSLDKKRVNNIQSEYHFKFVLDKMNFTNVCRTSKDVAETIEKYNIEAVVVGSDAVFQHHPLLSRIQFPSRMFFYIHHMTSERLFPNPFWGEFEPFLKEKIPIVAMSVSNQSSKFKYIIGRTKIAMKNAISRFDYISVRDVWTRKMIEYISGGTISPKITPDPVFAFEHNCGNLVSNKRELLNKYSLPEKYILFSLLRTNLVSFEWLQKLKAQAKSKGYDMVALPMPNGVLFKHPFNYEIPCPLSPLDWYGLIKHSCGYIGQNMHPTVVALANAVPVFCFDNYIRAYFYRMFANEKASKVYHILSVFKHPQNRCSIGYNREVIPSAEIIMDLLEKFDKQLCFNQSRKYLTDYLNMMSDIERCFKSNIHK